MAARSLHRRRARVTPRVPVRNWSAAHVSVCALGLALGVHALLLCGFSLRPIAPHTWRAPAPLIWVTRPREPAVAEIAAPLRAALAQPLRTPPTPPPLSPVATILAQTPLPQVPRDVSPSASLITTSGTAQSIMIPSRWQLEASGPLAATILSAWRRYEPPLEAAGSSARRPCVLEVRLSLPSFARRVIVLQSSGDPTWDAHVVRAVNNLALMPPGVPIAPSASYELAGHVIVGIEQEH
jgi:hypothetical protein